MLQEDHSFAFPWSQDSVVWLIDSDLQVGPLLGSGSAGPLPIQHLLLNISNDSWIQPSPNEFERLSPNHALFLWYLHGSPSWPQSLQAETRSCFWHIPLHHQPSYLIDRRVLCYFPNVSQVCPHLHLSSHYLSSPSNWYISPSQLPTHSSLVFLLSPLPTTYNSPHSIQNDLIVTQICCVTPIFIPSNRFPWLSGQMWNP